MQNINEKKYEQYVKQLTPTHSLPLNMAKAFLTGGLICLLGQVIVNTAQALGADASDSRTWCSVLLILLSVILTGFGIYPKIGKFGGAGSLVPITGFANSVAASAIEFRAEGQVFGIGCKIFTIAGPVILYGILSAWGYHEQKSQTWRSQHCLFTASVYRKCRIHRQSERGERSSWRSF